MSQQSTNFGLQRQAEFGRYLRSLRKRRGLKQKEVAEEFGVNLCDIEKGGRPASEHLLIELAKKYDVKLEEILQRKYQPQLPLLTGIMRPAEVEDLLKDLATEEIEEITQEIKRYTAFLLLRRSIANGQAISNRNQSTN